MYIYVQWVYSWYSGCTLNSDDMGCTCCYIKPMSDVVRVNIPAGGGRPPLGLRYTPGLYSSHRPSTIATDGRTDGGAGRRPSADRPGGRRAGGRPVRSTNTLHCMATFCRLIGQAIQRDTLIAAFSTALLRDIVWSPARQLCTTALYTVNNLAHHGSPAERNNMTRLGTTAAYVDE